MCATILELLIVLLHAYMEIILHGKREVNSWGYMSILWSYDDICALLQMVPSGLANLRNRDPDFPAPQDGRARGLQFDAVEVVRWALENRGPLHPETPKLARDLDRAIARLRQNIPPFTPDRSSGLLDLLTNDLDERASKVEARVLDMVKATGTLDADLTSPEITEWVLGLAGSIHGTVVDPACGWGSLLLSAALTLDDPAETAEFVGVDNNNTVLTGAWARFQSRGIPFQGVCADALALGVLDAWVGQTDLVIGDVPTGRADRSRQVPRMTEFGRPPSEDQGFLWLDLAYQLMKPGGRAVLVTHQRCLTDFVRAAEAGTAKSAKPSQQTRFLNALRESGAVRGMVTLPKGYRGGRSSSLALWVLEKPLTPPSEENVAQTRPVKELVHDGAAAIAASGDTRAAIARVAVQVWSTSEAPERDTPALFPVEAVEVPVQNVSGTQAPSDTTTTGVRRQIELTPSARASREGLSADIERVVKLLAQAQEFLAIHVPTVTDFQPLSDLIRDGSVACYFVRDGQPGLMLSRRRFGGEVMLRPAATITAKISADEEGADDVPLQAGDVIVAIDQRGRVNARIAESSDVSEIPVDKLGRLHGTQRTVVIRAHNTAGPEDIVFAIRSLDRLGWPHNSRGPMSVLDARHQIAVPIDQAPLVGGQSWPAVRNLILELPEQLKELADQFGDPVLLNNLNASRLVED